MANKSHTEITESTEIEPSQMAFYMGSPEGEKFLRLSGSKRQSRAVQNLIQNRTKQKEPSQMENFFVPQSFLCPTERKEIAESLMYEGGCVQMADVFRWLMAEG